MGEEEITTSVLTKADARAAVIGHLWVQLNMRPSKVSLSKASQIEYGYEATYSWRTYTGRVYLDGTNIRVTTD